MPTSVTGKPNSHFSPGMIPLMGNRRQASGFTLIEVLVVIVIIGTIVTIALLSMSLVSDDRELVQERTRLVSLFETIQDEAAMQGREFGIEFMVSAYRFVEFDPFTRTWAEVPGEDLFRQRTLPEGMEFELYVDEKRVVLRDEPRQFDDPKKNSMLSSNGNYTPHVFVFASGESTVFELRMRRDVNEQELVIRSDIFGDIEIVENEG